MLLSIYVVDMVIVNPVHRNCTIKVICVLGDYFPGRQLAAHRTKLHTCVDSFTGFQQMSLVYNVPIMAASGLVHLHC